MEILESVKRAHWALAPVSRTNSALMVKSRVPGGWVVNLKSIILFAIPICLHLFSSVQHLFMQCSLSSGFF